jgi:ribosomal protein S18 acetylase RimI-like enzyme
VFNIRNASAKDIPLVRDLTFRVWPRTYASLLSAEQIEYMLELMYSEKSLAEQMEQGIRFIIVYDDQDPVGFAAYEKIGLNLWKLHKLYVLSSEQGKGTGRFVMDHIIEKIIAEGAQALQLQVKRDNKARFFYEKLGFDIIEEKDFDIGKGYLMMDYIMEKKF